MSNTPGAGSNDRLSITYVVKWVFAGIIIFGGIAGGVYTGMALSNAGYGRASSEVLINNTYLDPGEQFPNYELRDIFDSSTTSIHAMADKGPVLLVFVSSSCGACEAMNAFWGKKVFSGLEPGIQLVWVYDQDESPPKANELATYGVRMMQTDRRRHLKEDGISATPTLIGLRADRTIQFIYTGFDRHIGSSEINELM